MTLTVSVSAAGDIAALPGTTQAVQVTALTGRGGGDSLAGGVAINVFQVVAASTVTLGGGSTNAGANPTTLRVQFNSPRALSSSETIVLTASQSVFTASVSSGLTDPNSIFASYVTTSATVFTGTLGSTVALNTGVDFTLPDGMTAALPFVAVAVTIDITLAGTLSFDDETGFGTIVATGVRLDSVSSSTGYLTSSTPGSIIIVTSHGTADSAGPIVYTFDTSLFGVSKTPTCSAALSSGSATFTCASDGTNGRVLTATLASGSIAAGTKMTLTITDSAAGDIAALPGSTQAVQITALTGRGGADTINGGSAINVFQVVGAPTLTLTSANTAAPTDPSTLRIQFNSPRALSSGDTIVLTASQDVLTPTVTSGVTDPNSIFSSYVTSSKTTFTGTLGTTVALNAAVDFTLPDTMTSALPYVAGPVTMDFILGGFLSLDDATGFGTIVATGINLISVRISTGYVVGTTPGSIVITTTHNQADGAGPIIYTFDTPMFGGSKSPTCSAVLSTGSATFTCRTDATYGKELTATLTSGSFAAGVTLTMTITDSSVGDIIALPSVTQTFQMQHLTGAAGAQTLAGGAQDLFQTVALPTITLSGGGTMVAGTDPTTLRIQFNTPLALESGDTIVLTASRLVFTASVTTGLTDPNSIFASYITTSSSVFTGTLGSNVALNAAVDFTLPDSMTAVLPTISAHVMIDFTLAGSLAIDNALGFGTIFASPGAGADPVARLGDTIREFELPLHTLTPLMTTPEMTIHGSVFPGNPDEQWFDRMVFSVPADSRFLEIRVKKDLEHVNASKVPPGSFSTLDIHLGYGDLDMPSHIGIVPGLDAKIPFHFLGQHVVVRRMRRHHNVRFPMAGGFHRECVDVAGVSLHFYVCSAPADEYYGDLHHLSLRYMHLDIGVIEALDFKKLTGLLPELWGIQPMSANTESYIKEDKSLNKVDISKIELSEKDAAYNGNLAYLCTDKSNISNGSASKTCLA
eukprot:TRINITY_DN14240_c0_g1_i1.p1 TRINITY_DN14240_c0_g1~~TRINITY_DN14240_c0_g1_i1.p1  ORF type:complete len:1119 (+),score=124.63 TRINITY_DN14240_c0_g1_i1:425-3358(+)